MGSGWCRHTGGRERSTGAGYRRASWTQAGPSAAGGPSWWQPVCRWKVEEQNAWEESKGLHQPLASLGVSWERCPHISKQVGAAKDQTLDACRESRAEAHRV